MNRAVWTLLFWNPTGQSMMRAGYSAVALAAFVVLGEICQALPATDEKRAARMVGIAREYLGSGRVTAALNTLESVVRLHGLTDSAAEAQWEIAGLYARNREPMRAFKQYSRLIRSFPDSGYHDRAQAAQMNLLRGMVNAHRERAAQGDKAKPPAGQPDTQTLKSMLREVVSDGRYSKVAPEAQFALASVLEADGSPKTAKRTHEEFLERYPAHALADDATFQIAYIEFKRVQAGDIRRAQSADLHFIDFISRYPKSPKVPVAHFCRDRLKRYEGDAIIQMAEYYLAQGNAKAALVNYDRLANRFPARLKQDAALASEVEALRVRVAEGE